MSAAEVIQEPTPLADPLIGSRVGLYILDRRIGQGGMGIIYLARHERIGQLAAVKVLLRELAQDGKVLQRFLDEARAMTLVQHPSIVKVFDYGQLVDGTPYIMMELLEGESLQQRINSAVEHGAALPLPSALGIARQIASALASIHQKNIIHRDLKPENLFVVPDPLVPSGERVKLLDFGLAKILDEQVGRTTEGMVLGTPLYMSPEQCDGSNDIDAKADVYALGALLFEMLVGRPPFLATSASALMYQHVHKPAPRLSDVAQDVPLPLIDLLLVMLAKRPAERPRMDEVAARLEALEHEARDRGPLVLHGQTPLVLGEAVSDGLSATIGPEIEMSVQSGTPPPTAPSTTPPAAAPAQPLPPRRQSLDALPLLSAMRPRGAAWQGAVAPAPEPVEAAPVAEPAPPAGLARPSRSFDLEMVAPPSQPTALPTAVVVRVPRWILLAAVAVLVLVLVLVLRSTAARRSVEPPSAVRTPAPTATPASPATGPAPPAGPAGSAPSPGAPSEVGSSVNSPSDKLDGDAGKRRRREPGKRQKLKRQDGDPMTVFREQ
ncbi:MAG: serine/threonine-protein kinase [Polyangia bacterium]